MSRRARTRARTHGYDPVGRPEQRVARVLAVHRGRGCAPNCTPEVSAVLANSSFGSAKTRCGRSRRENEHGPRSVIGTVLNRAVPASVHCRPSRLHACPPQSRWSSLLLLRWRPRCSCLCPTEKVHPAKRRLSTPSLYVQSCAALPTPQAPEVLRRRGCALWPKWNRSHCAPALTARVSASRTR